MISFLCKVFAELYTVKKRKKKDKSSIQWSKQQSKDNAEAYHIRLYDGIENFKL